MRVVVTGATGNVGASLLAALGREPTVTEIVGLARRVPRLDLPKVRRRQADVTTTPLGPIFDGAVGPVRRPGRPRVQRAAPAFRG